MFCFDKVCVNFMLPFFIVYPPPPAIVVGEENSNGNIPKKWNTVQQDRCNYFCGIILLMNELTI